MARFEFLKPDELKTRIANSELLKSKALRIAVAACVFCFVLGTGLSYLIVRNAQNQQRVVLSNASERVGQIFRTRLLELEPEVREVVKRVELVSTQIVDAAYAAGTPPPAGDIPGEPSNGSKLGGVSPLEARWRERLEGALREMMESRGDVLDITYLGRFTAIPNGALTVVRVERTRNGELVTSQEDPRPDWDASFLQSVIQSDIGTAKISAPVIVEENGEARFALIRGADPVRDSDHTVVGVAMVSLELSDVLGRMTEDLPETATSLLVTDEGLSLLHPTAEGKFESAESGARVIDGLYPGLLAGLEKNNDATSHSFAAESFVAHLSRFTVAGDASDVRFTWVLAAPHAPVDFTAAMRSAGTLAVGVISGRGTVALAAGCAAGLALLAAGFLIVRRRRSVAGIGEEGKQDAARFVAERASAIDAEELELALRADRADEAADAADAAKDDDRDDAFAAEAVEDSSEAYEVATIEDAGDEPQACEARDDSPVMLGEASASEVSISEVSSSEVSSEDKSAEPEPRPTVSGVSFESAPQLSTARNRLEVELEEARQRSLDELAAARERFEMELAGERDRAIARLIAESRRALASDARDFGFKTVTPELPSIESGEFDLRDLLAEVAAWMEGETFGRDQEFGIRCNRNVPNKLVGDPNWLGPLLVKLGKNAVQSSEGGRVELIVTCADDGTAGVRVCFELRARDAGFDALAGGRPGQRRLEGLARVEELVESMHGELRVERLSSTDSTLRVVLPMWLAG